MKTNTDRQIKSQLEQRNLNPSEHSWAKLSQMMDEEKPPQKTFRFPKWWTMAVAASVAVLVGVLALNPFGKNEIEEPRFDKLSVTTQESQNEESNLVKSNPEQKNKMISEEIPMEIVEVKPEIISSEKTKIHSKLNSDKKEEFILENAKEIAQNPVTETEISKPELNLNLSENEVSPKIASTEIPETKPEKKKSKYVDADMLLYSIENNQNISESKDNSKLVIIDFNK